MNVIARDCLIYPVKSCAGVRVGSLAFDDGGRIIGDRQWLVADESWRVTWMGAHPRLALVRPELTPEGWQLCSPSRETVQLPPPEEGAPCAIQIWNGERGAFDTLEGRDTGDQVAAMVSETVGSSVHVVSVATERHCSPPVHVVALPSLRQFGEESGVGRDLDPDYRRFRPNLVFDAAPGNALEPFSEERAAAFSGSALTLRVSGRCERCIMVDVDPDTAEKDDRYFAATKLQTAQRLPGKPASFGIYARSHGRGSLSVGDILSVRWCE